MYAIRSYYVNSCARLAPSARLGGDKWTQLGVVIRLEVVALRGPENKKGARWAPISEIFGGAKGHQVTIRGTTWNYVILLFFQNKTYTTYTIRSPSFAGFR